MQSFYYATTRSLRSLEERRGTESIERFCFCYLSADLRRWSQIFCFKTRFLRSLEDHRGFWVLCSSNSERQRTQKGCTLKRDPKFIGFYSLITFVIAMAVDECATGTSRSTLLTAGLIVCGLIWSVRLNWSKQSINPFPSFSVNSVLSSRAQRGGWWINSLMIRFKLSTNDPRKS